MVSTTDLTDGLFETFLLITGNLFQLCDERMATGKLSQKQMLDGKIFVYNVTRVVKVRTGEEDYAALQDVE